MTDKNIPAYEKKGDNAITDFSCIDFKQLKEDIDKDNVL